MGSNRRVFGIMAAEVLVYCDSKWGKRGDALTAYNEKLSAILSFVPFTEKADKLALWEYTYNARIQTGDLVSCRPADQGIGWNKKRRILVRIENISLEEMQRFVNASFNINVSFLGKSGELCKYKSRYKFIFSPMVAGEIYKFNNLKDAKMIDKTDAGHITKVIG